MYSGHPLESVDKPRRRQRVWSEPAAQIEKCPSNTQKNDADACQSSQSAACGQRRRLIIVDLAGSPGNILLPLQGIPE